MQLNDTFQQQLVSSQTSLKQFAFKFTHDMEIAEDLLQDTLLKAMRYHTQYREGTNMKGWLFTIMRNTFINGYRSNQRKNTLITTEEEISSSNLLESSTSNKGDAKFVMEDIQRAMAKLPENCSKPFLRYFEGYKYHEIAEELQIPIGTVKTRIHMARGLLQKQLAMYKK